MTIEPLNKDIYNKALELGIEKINLSFSGGSDQGYLDVDLVPWNSKNQPELVVFAKEVEDWAWEVYNYGGAGDGTEYGDDVVYDLVNKKVITSEWYTARQEGESDECDLDLNEE